MRSRRRLFFWFLVPFVAAAAWLNLIKAFMTSWPGPFERFGSVWIWLKSGFYGTAGLLVGLAVMSLNSRFKRGWLPLALAVLLIGADLVHFDRVWDNSYVDEAIDFIGYQLSRVSPHVSHDDPIPSGQLLPIPPMTRVDVRTPIGSLSITSGRGLLRNYTWDGATRALELIPPSSEMYGEHSFHTRHFRGNGDRIPAYDWEIHNGITRGEAWESQKDFKTLGEAETWLRSQQNETMPYVWTHDGLAIGWSTRVDYKALTVEVYQIMVNGQKPSRLAGSDDSKIVMRSL